MGLADGHGFFEGIIIQLKSIWAIIGILGKILVIAVIIGLVFFAP